MINAICSQCQKELPAEEMLYCSYCYKCFCPDCAAREHECDCKNKLAYFD